MMAHIRWKQIAAAAAIVGAQSCTTWREPQPLTQVPIASASAESRVAAVPSHSEEPLAADRRDLMLSPPNVGVDATPSAITESASPPSAADVVARFEMLGARVSFNAVGEAETLDASESAVTDFDLALIGSLSALKQLNLRGTSVTDAALSHLAKLEQLEFLGLSRTAVSDAGMESVARCRNLRFLTLGDTQVGDASATVLSRVTGLEGLNVEGSMFTRAGIEQLEEALPACKIVGDVLEPKEAAVPVPQAVERPALISRRDTQPLVSASRLTASPASPSADARLRAVLAEQLLEPCVLEALGDVHQARGNLGRAAAAYEAALELDPDDAGLRCKLGLAEAMAGDSNAARRHLLLAVEAPQAHYRLALAHYARGEWNACEQAAREALAADPQMREPRELLAMLAAQGGRPDAAAAHESEPLDLLLQALSEASVLAPTGPWKVAIQPSEAAASVRTR
jgi:tetratricopeptide (TPR) repeat protein